MVLRNKLHIYNWLKMLWSVILLATIASCQPYEEPYKAKFDYRPYLPKDSADWRVAASPHEQMDVAKLDEAYKDFFAADKYKTSISLLVIRNGLLVGEGYARGEFYEDYERKNNIKSATKSVTSLLAGIAVDKGLLDIDKTIYHYLPEYFPQDDEKRNITVRQALEMRTGLLWKNDEDTWDLMIDKHKSSLKLILDKPMEFSPGKGFRYTDANPHLVAAVIQKVAGKPLEEFAKEYLFVPLSIKDYYWEKHQDGINYGAVALYLSARNFAKIGQLVLQKGKWENKQIISESWLAESVKTQATAAETGSADYGLYWWIRPQHNAIVARGHGGQYLYIVPDKNLLIVHTAMPYTGNGYRGITLQEIEHLADIIISGCK